MGRDRPAKALVALLVWVLGFELAPAVHVAFHAELGHHHHEGDAPLAWSAGHDHGHDHDHAHSHEGSRARDDGKPQADAPLAGMGHGAHGLAHKNLAAQAPVVGLPPIVAPCLTRLAQRFTPPEAPSTLRRDPARARGPPAWLLAERAS